MSERIINPEIIKRESLLLISGVFGPGDVNARLHDQILQPPSELADNIEREWEPKAQKGWSPMALVHVNAFGLDHNSKEPDEHALDLDFGRTNGKDFMGASNWRTWREKNVVVDPTKIPQPLVTSTVLITSDGKMVVQERGVSAHQSGNIDALGGLVDPKDDVNPQTGEVDLFGSAKRELMEETGLSEEQITEIVCLGLIYNYSDTSHYAMPFVATTQLSSEEVLELARSEEEEKQVTLRVVDVKGKVGGNPKHVYNVIRNRLPNVDPEARLTIALARRYARQHPAAPKQYGSQEGVVQTFKKLS